MARMIQDSQNPHPGYIVSIGIEDYGLDLLQRIIPGISLQKNELSQYITAIDQYKINPVSFSRAYNAEYWKEERLVIDLLDSAKNGTKSEFVSSDEGFGILSILEYIMLQNPYYYNRNETKKYFVEMSTSHFTNSVKNCNEIEMPPVLQSFIEQDNYFGYILFTENGTAKTLASIIAASINTGIYKKCSVDFKISATQVLFALKAYKDANSYIPLELTELVPEYIEKLPTDPFTGEVLLYSANDKTLYSKGAVFKDNKEKDRFDYEGWAKPESRYYRVNL
jgi:electron transfer flavoprotein alpha subunit